MSEPVFNIAFYGIIQPEKDREMVIENMASLFKTTPEKIRPYFAGGRKVIKAGLDELAAEKYRVALENVGLVIKIEAADTESNSDAGQAESAPNNRAGSSDVVSAAGASNASPAVEAQQNIDTGDLSMAEVGADVLANPPVVEPQPIGDISGITLAEVGADILDSPVQVKAQAIADFSHITLADVDTPED